MTRARMRPVHSEPKRILSIRMTSMPFPTCLSVLVQQGGVSHFLAGDTTYTQEFLIDRKADGVSPDKGQTLSTIDKIHEYAKLEQTVYLPTHDPSSVLRLEKTQVIDTHLQP